MCGISNIGADVAEKLEQAMKSGTPEDRKAVHESASRTRMYAVAILAVSLFLAILGVALCATGLAPGFGIFLFLVSAAAFYVGYNAYKTLSNAKDMVDNFQKYRPQPPAVVVLPVAPNVLPAAAVNLVGMGPQPQPAQPPVVPQVNWSEIKKDLKTGTFLFDWAIDPKVENIAYRGVVAAGG